LGQGRLKIVERQPELLSFWDPKELGVLVTRELGWVPREPGDCAKQWPVQLRPEQCDVDGSGDLSYKPLRRKVERLADLICAERADKQRR
jgi:hypothetical protein